VLDGLYRRLFEADAARGFRAPRMLLTLGLYLLFALLFATFRVSNDGLVYYNFLRRFLGEAVPGYAYQFGVAYFNAPFYLAARAVEEVTGLTSLLGAPLRETAIGIASNVALVLTLYVGYRLLRRLELPAGPGVLVLTLFGTPLFYYTAFQPSYKHAVDALFLTLVAYLLLDCLERPSTSASLALGACLAMLVAIRYANIGLVPGVLLAVLLRRDWERLRGVTIALALTGILLFGLPVARDIPFKRQNEAAARAPTPVEPPAPRELSAGILPHINDPCPDTPVYVIDWSQCLRNKLGIRLDARAPIRMLGSERRGLFLWTPLTAFAVLGMALLFRSRPERRTFLVGLTAAAVFLVGIHALWGDFWTNGFSFSQRFLASLFPFYLLGTAELLRRFKLGAATVLTVCALFSVFAGFNHFLGYRGISERDGLGAVLTTRGDRDVTETLRLIGTRALERLGLK
jgi:dolichyl-phosphate-mannose-protein mannosyltransferase